MRRISGAAVLALALAGGCAGSGLARPEGPPEVHPTWRSCDEARGGDRSAGPSGRPRLSDGGGDVDVFRLPLLDDGFTAVAVTVCGTGPLIPPGGGADPATTERRAESVDALVAALRLPDERRTNDPCTANLVILPWFALHDAQGRWVRPGVPADACGKPRREVREAFDGLTFARPPGAGPDRGAEPYPTPR
ncbi:hypothetical protein [Jidongwangia harbinensis]|uniref:hypothetical protein n=1 Tax=Jidongwangia harbinensis TaxID=2878561 RepID=UPI001CD96E06|nr:hypothetical protein [Jidongwangia harbinensis]MCA2217333.1 hypothetical protein [Jidongwangia harbinensis]